MLRGLPKQAKGRPSERPVTFTETTVQDQGDIIDLEAERFRRRRALAVPTAGAPCAGVCTCWGGVPLGGQP